MSAVKHPQPEGEVPRAPRWLALRGHLARALSGFRSTPESIRVWGRGLALVISAAPATAAAYIALVSVLELVPVAQVWLMKLLVDRLAAGAGGPAPVASEAMSLAAAYVVTLVVPSGLRPLQKALSAWLEDQAVAEVDRRLMRAGTRLVDLARIERPAFQDELSLLHQAAYRPPRLLAFVQYGFGTALTVAGLLVLLTRLHPLLPVLLAVAAVPHMYTERHLQRLVYEAMARRSRAAREMDYCANVTTRPGAAKEVRIFGLGDFFRQRFHDRFAAAFAEVHQLRLAYLRRSALLGGIHALALAGGFWYVASSAGAGRLTLGDVALYLGAIAQAESRLQLMSNWWGMLYEILLHLRGLFGFLDSAGPAIRLAPSGQARRAPSQVRQGVELRRVRFAYPESKADVLQEVSARLPAGKVTALVGANGAGKSTLVKLLTRMYDPCAPPGSTQPPGEILLDGVPLHDYDLESLRRHIAVMYQDFARFALTLGDNIGVGADVPGIADGCVETAARWAGADEVAAKLPQGYETLLTRRFAGGVELSGGEWQKVALARAFVRDAALVILDEPTAALDAEAEYRLFERFRELVAGKTALLISHRFSTVRMADHILVLEDGRIVESGSHDELVARGGRYATLYQMQASRYR